MLEKVTEQAVVLLGPPGSGKSTLLRHFELDGARAALAEHTGGDLSQAPLTFFVPLNDFKPDRVHNRLPPPQDWLAERWEAHNSALPALDILLWEQRLTLLLDALNEIPAVGTEPVRLWKEFLRELARIAAGLALGELGDPRFERRQGPDGAYLLPPLIDIPGGTYRIGSDEGYEHEAPVHRVTLTPFAMAQFPVTNAEWALFMQAGGYAEERWWETEEARAWRRGEGTAEGPKQQLRENRKFFQENFDNIRQWHQEGRITSENAEDWEAIARMSDEAFEDLLAEGYPDGRQTQPAFWNDDAFNNPAQPVVGICWFEARAYCVWLSMQTGEPFRLPTEAEWEAAACGRRRRRYAFGNDFDATRCNVFEIHIHHTTPIGVFPGGETPEGLVDMTGNTWDWTSSLYKPYLYDAADGREDSTVSPARRVVRGGSWYHRWHPARVLP